MKAWWEFLQVSGAKFATIGMLGPLPGKDYSVVRLCLFGNGKQAELRAASVSEVASNASFAVNCA